MSRGSGFLWLLLERFTCEPLDRDPAAIAKVHSKSGYGRIGASLGLSSQGEQIRYERPRFRRCDMTIQEMIRELSQVLRKEPDRRRIAVFHGSGHHADLERRLRKLGYSPAGPVSWESAIISNPYSDGISESDVREALNER